MSPHSDLTATRRTALQLTGTAALLGLGAGVAGADPGGDDGRTVGPKESELLVGVSNAADGPPERVVAERIPAHATVAGANRTLRYVAVDVPDDAERVAERLRAHPHVKYVEPNVTVTKPEAVAASDPYADQQYAPDLVNAPEAWETTDGSGATVAVVDTGIEYDHPDLEANVADAVGIDTPDGDDDPSPDSPSETFHGTHVAGIAAADTNNDVGIAGISDASFLAVKALDDGGAGSVSDISDAIVWSADNDADVINLSLGSMESSETLHNAVKYAYGNGVTVVAAAGNNGAEGVAYPAQYDEAVAVTAVDEDEAFASFSNYGDAADVTAPGVGIASTVPEAAGGYARMSGTSMASPVVAGVAALLVDSWGVTDPETVRSHLTATARDVGLPETQQGGGLVDAAAAVGREPGSSGTDGTDDGSADGDSDGSTDSDTSEEDGGATVTVEASGSGTLSKKNDRDYRQWTVRTEDVERVTVALSGPADADFNLYGDVGEWPRPASALKRSESPSSDERVVFTASNVSAGDTLGLLAKSHDGSGEYEISIKEYA